MGDRLASVLGSNPQNQIFKNLFRTIQINCKSPLNAFIAIKCPKTLFLDHFQVFFLSQIPYYYMQLCLCTCYQYVFCSSKCSALASHQNVWGSIPQIFLKYKNKYFFLIQQAFERGSVSPGFDSQPTSPFKVNAMRDLSSMQIIEPIWLNTIFF